MDGKNNHASSSNSTLVSSAPTPAHTLGRSKLVRGLAYIFNPKSMYKALRFIRTHGLRMFAAACFSVLTGRLQPNTNPLGLIDAAAWLQENMSKESFTQNKKRKYKEPIYIILPIFNGYEYFDTLFCSIPKTNLLYELLIVEDCSSDERVRPYLRSLAASDNRITLVENDENIGFVKSVNIALKLAKNHISLLNSDIELPEYWLDRLMYPILFKKKVASSTPFTNAGTICSFPKPDMDNPLFEGFSVAQIDEAFSHVKPMYMPIPTGVGFCMGLNFKAIQEIGIFDDITFSKGYGEENDWCQRAIKAGYKNAMVENLFVYHKHGGSFPSDERAALVKENTKKLSQKHPNYCEDVAAFFELDPAKHVRNFVAMHMLSKLAKKQVLAFDHNLGGGATTYLSNAISEEVKSKHVFMVVSYDKYHNYYTLKFHGSEYEFTYRFASLECLQKVLAYFPCSEVRINELVYYPNIYNTIRWIAKLKNALNAKQIMYIHDYFSLCPSYNLLNHKHEYCGVPDIETCTRCFSENRLISDNDKAAYNSIQTWRKHWVDLLRNCDELIAFSNSTKSIFEKAYGSGYNVKVVPHQVDYITKHNRMRKTTDTMNIGILGRLDLPKGLHIVRRMSAMIEERRLNMRIVLLGYSEHPETSEYYMETGEYTPSELPSLVLQHDIDIIFISSICPETFSYTCEEAIKMDMPVACFNIGAPAERVAVYEKGLIIDKIHANDALKQIQRFIEMRSKA